MDQDTKSRLADRSIWVRALYMIILVIAYSIGETLLAFIAVFQFLSALITGRVNDSLQSFGANLSAYLYDILQFATFNTEELPFPFNDWPDVDPGETPWSARAETTEADVEPLREAQPEEPVEPEVHAEPTQEIKPDADVDDNPTKPSGA